MLPFPLGGNCPVPSRTAGRGSPTGQRHGHPDSTQACRFPAPPASLKLCGFLPDSVVPAEEAPRLRGKRDKLTPGPGSGMDTRPLGLQGGGREKLSLGRSPGGTRGSGQCVYRGGCALPQLLQQVCEPGVGDAKGAGCQGCPPEHKAGGSGHWLCRVKRMGAPRPVWGLGRLWCPRETHLLASCLGSLRGTSPGLASHPLQLPVLAFGPVSGATAKGHPGPSPPCFSCLSPLRRHPPPPLAAAPRRSLRACLPPFLHLFSSFLGCPERPPKF